MKNTAVANNTTIQPSLWEVSQEEEWPVALGVGPDEYAIRTIRFPWASGETSNEWAQRMFAHVNGAKHYLLDMLHCGRFTASLYADVLDCWIDNGVVTGRCKLTIGGPDVERLRAGQVVDEEEEDL